MNYFKNLEIWKESINLVLEVYALTKKMPKEEIYSLTNQIKRCCVSIPSNIAEGAGRKGNKEFINFLSIANGSCCELNTQLTIALKLGYLNDQEVTTVLSKLEIIQRMMVNFLKRLNDRIENEKAGK